MEGAPGGVLDISLELAPYRKAGSYWLREVSQSVIGGHWRSLIRLIRLIRLDLQCGWDGWDWVEWDWSGWDGYHR